MRARAVSIDKIVFLLLIIFSIIPDIGIKFSTAGFNWTVYRLIVLITLLWVVFAIRRLSIDMQSTFSKWIVFMGFWTVYGLVLLFAGKYVEFHDGFVEWLSIFNGLIVFYLMSIFLQKEENRRLTFKLLYWLLNFLLIFAVIEIVTGHHMPMSIFNDSMSAFYSLGNVRMATGFMYNMNDFSALLTCMTPILLYSGIGKKRRIITFVGVLLINIFNNALTCVLAIVCFLFIYLFFFNRSRIRNLYILKLILCIVVIAAIVILIVFQNELAKREDFFGSFFRQFTNAKQSTGSLYVRLIIYKDALQGWVSSGMLGMGPGGFSNFFSDQASMSGLSNPHALIMEMLTEYGIIITTWFLWRLFSMLRTALRKFRVSVGKIKEPYMMVIEFVFIYCIVSFAPSSFIGYSYQWLLLAVMCAQLDTCTELGGIVYA